jgi:hypothetical protein
MGIGPITLRTGLCAKGRSAPLVRPIAGWGHKPKRYANYQRNMPLTNPTQRLVKSRIAMPIAMTLHRLMAAMLSIRLT